MTNETKEKHKKIFNGSVIKKSGSKTIVVEVERKLQHSKYKKFVLRTKKYHAHDEKEQFNVGDKVAIIESKPISKLKKWVALSL